MTLFTSIPWSWRRTWSETSVFVVLFVAIASISSKKTMAGAHNRALLKKLKRL